MMKLKLFHSQASPYVRKVMVMAIECGVVDRIDFLPAAASPVNRDQSIVAHNPTGKVPTAILPNGTALFDSRVICRFIASLAGEAADAALYPAGEDGFRVLTLEALADGLLDAALLLRYETMMRPEALRWPEWIAGQQEKIASSLVALEQDHRPILEDGFNAGAIATACALGYLDFRFSALNWRDDHPALAAWHAEAMARPSLQQTMPG